ncbi:ABC transporter permease [Acidisoma cellulosilytica]|uniref:ABC transporter permease n=1 Tax=Acidisoma cellulosilyticum TaxID=2802395 RepID=A0A964E641_9PROT|nr:ABC transporter permease [Acidisoma cellulosilyticum]MCB8882618.1 ABC transporter permease [Acidisoma cellulosilyticum]
MNAVVKSGPSKLWTDQNRRFDPRRLFRSALPGLSLLIVLAAIYDFNPRAISYFGFNLMLNLAVPVALATAAQLCIIAVSDLDLSIGAYVGFIACVTTTWLPTTPLLGTAAILASIVAYGALGALVHWRQLPSIVVTLGMSFVWLGLALFVRPQPGGLSPVWLSTFMGLHVPYVPFPIVAAVVLAIVLHLVLMNTAFGAVLRGAGGNATAVGRSGWSLLRIKATAYAMAGVLGSLAGLSLVGVSSSADANMANGYTLLSIAGAILGGAEFIGGRISPIGAVMGALTLQLATVALNFFQLPEVFPGFRIPPEWQVGAQGIILIVILAIRALINRGEA